MFPGQPYETRRTGIYRHPMESTERQGNREKRASCWSHSETERDMSVNNSMTPEEASQHVTIWNRVECRKVAGNAAPLRRNLERYLAKHPECEVYMGQDKNLNGSVAIGSVDPKTGSTIVAGNEHVPMWNKIEERKITGNAAPLRKNVEAYLTKHPECEIYMGQDRDNGMAGLETKKGKALKESMDMWSNSGGGGSGIFLQSTTTQDSLVTSEEQVVEENAAVLREEQTRDLLHHDNISMSLDSNSGVLMDPGNIAVDTGMYPSHSIGATAYSPVWNEFNHSHHNNNNNHSMLWQSSSNNNNNMYSSSWNRSLLASNNVYGYSPNNPTILPPIHGRAVPIPGRDSTKNTSLYGMEDASWSSTLFVGSYGAGSGLTPLTGSLDMELYSENMSPSVFLLSGQSPANTTSSSLRWFPWKNIGGNTNNYSNVFPNNNNNTTNTTSTRSFMGMPQGQ